MTLHSEVTNNSDSPLDVVMIAAWYDTDGVLLGTKSESYRIAAKHNGDCTINSIRLGNEFDKLKVFVWEADSFEPVPLITDIGRNY